MLLLNVYHCSFYYIFFFLSVLYLVVNFNYKKHTSIEIPKWRKHIHHSISLSKSAIFPNEIKLYHIIVVINLNHI